MRRMVEKILRYYGREIQVLRSKGTLTVYGFIQPVRGKGKDMAQKVVSHLGTVATGQFVYIGPAEPELAEGDILTDGGKTYVMRRSEVIDGTNGPAYRWGMCVEKEAFDQWGMSG